MTPLAIDEVLGPGGFLARAIPGYEDRPGQREMAEEVERSLADESTAILEAGTGTGKTMAYLVPALLSGKRVVISTGTRALQDQIAGGDIPLLRSALPFSFKASVLKGTQNYVCRRRFADALHAQLDEDSRRDFDAIEAWVDDSETGDRSELKSVSPNAAIWNLLTTSPEARLGKRCPYARQCFVARARKEALESELVVVNHYLFFADLALRNEGGHILPDYDAVIFDEAHLLEEAVTQHFSTVIDEARLESLWTDLAVHNARNFHQELSRELPRLRSLGLRLLDQVQEVVKEPGRRVHLPEDFGQSHAWQEAWFAMDGALADLATLLREHAEDAAGTEHGEEARVLARRADFFRDDLANVSEQEQRKKVYWAVRERTGFRIGGSPIDTGFAIREHLLPQTPSVIFTSATLSSDGDFRYAREMLGVDPDDQGAIFPSPFDYSEQALLYLARDLPAPTEIGYPLASERRIAELCALTGGGTLVLFTSHRALSEAVRRLAGRLPGPLLAQGQAPSDELIRELRENPSATLLATGSFWQGVDIPGSALRQVIVARLPFSPPDDPLARARGQAVAERGLDPFDDFLLPRAVLSLRQGLGRLIRRTDDRGLLAILDSRIATKRYGRAFTRSLPEGLPRTSSMEQVTRWWRRSMPEERSEAAVLRV